jgi:hypothetical protein
MRTDKWFLVGILLLPIFAGSANGAGVEQWTVFETSYESAKVYSNAFTEVEVDVVFKQGDKHWKVPAFWAGDKKWTVRFAPPEQGKFTYRVECTDKANADLNGKEQTLSVAAYTGDNPLLKHGFVQVTPGKTCFEHADCQSAWPTDVPNTERRPLQPDWFKPEQTWQGKTYQLGYEHCDTICKKWFWVEGDRPRPVSELAQLYRDTHATGGNLLLNVPPDRTGLIPEYHVKALMELKEEIK